MADKQFKLKCHIIIKDILLGKVGLLEGELTRVDIGQIVVDFSLNDKEEKPSRYIPFTIEGIASSFSFGSMENEDKLKESLGELIRRL